MGGWYRLFSLTSPPVTPGPLGGCSAAASFLPVPASEPLARSMVHSAKAWGPEGAMAASLCPWAQRIWIRQAL